MVWYVQESQPYGEYVWLTIAATAEEAVANVTAVAPGAAVTEEWERSTFAAFPMQAVLDDIAAGRTLAVCLGGHQE